MTEFLGCNLSAVVSLRVGVSPCCCCCHRRLLVARGRSSIWEPLLAPFLWVFPRGVWRGGDGDMVAVASLVLASGVESGVEVAPASVGVLLRAGIALGLWCGTYCALAAFIVPAG